MRADLKASIDATRQHISLIDHRIGKLRRRRMEAVEQVLSRIGSEYRCGAIGFDDMASLYEEMRRLDVSAGLWGEITGLTYKDLFRELHRRRRLARNPPNGPRGSWMGSWPLPEQDSRPPKGTAVVYVLFNSANEPCYVGSTGDFRTRLAAHAKTKSFVAWQAYPCKDREHAYQMEDKVLKQYKPYLNGRAGR